MIKLLYLIYQLALFSPKVYRYFKGIDYQALLYTIKLGKMEGSNILLTIGFGIFGSSFGYDDFWKLTNDMTTTLLNVVAIISILTGSFLKLKSTWPKIKAKFKREK